MGHQLHAGQATGDQAASPGTLLSGPATPITRDQAHALAIDLSRRSTPADAGGAGGDVGQRQGAGGATGASPAHVDTDHLDRAWLTMWSKLATERLVSLDATTLDALDEWAQQRGTHRPIPHPRTGALTDFLFTARGRRLGATRLRNGLLAAAEAAGLRAPDGQARVVTCHQLRHTCAMTLQGRGVASDATFRG